MLSKTETQIWREGYDLHGKYRDQLTTPEKWIEFSDAVRDMVNSHDMDEFAVQMGMFLLDVMNEAYRDGKNPEPVQSTFFDEEAYA